MANPSEFAHHFTDLPDPRIERTKKHALIDILFITLCAVIVGASSWEAVRQFGVSKKDWLKTFVPLKNGIPSADTFERLFARIQPKMFQACVMSWLAELGDLAGLKHVAIDGKALRGTPDSTFSGCLHLVQAWSVENQLFLGQEAVAEHSNEIPAIPKLLEVLELNGALVTIDAAGCQHEIAQQIRDQGGDYLLCVKGNQPGLQSAVQGIFTQAIQSDFVDVKYTQHETIENGHGRHDERYVTVIEEPTGLPKVWPDVAAVVQVNRERTVDGKTTTTSHYYISSRKGSAGELGGFIRSHWAIENGLHWCLDVTFGEDAKRLSSVHAAENLGVLRRVGVSLLKGAPGKGYVPNKQLKAALDETYLEQVLQGK